MKEALQIDGKDQSGEIVIMILISEDFVYTKQKCWGEQWKVNVWT